MPFVDEMPTRRVYVPDEEGSWFEIRELSWKELDECHREQQRKYVNRVRELGGEIIKAVGEIESTAAAKPDSEEAAQIEAARQPHEKPGADLDPELLIMKSVVGWSYEQRFQASRLQKLDERTFTWLFEEIAKVYERDEAEKKTD